MIFQLANYSTRTPRGVIEDIFIKVDEFIFSVDFIILETESATKHAAEIPIFLG